MSAVWQRLEGRRQEVQTALRSVEAALAHLGSGTYGVCEVCGAAISAGRLEVRPTTNRCIDCARRHR